jgi:hypothetical protein
MEIKVVGPEGVEFLFATCAYREPAQSIGSSSGDYCRSEVSGELGHCRDGQIPLPWPTGADRQPTHL